MSLRCLFLVTNWILRASGGICGCVMPSRLPEQLGICKPFKKSLELELLWRKSVIPFSLAATVARSGRRVEKSVCCATVVWRWAKWWVESCLDAAVPSKPFGTSWYTEHVRRLNLVFMQSVGAYQEVKAPGSRKTNALGLPAVLD